MLKSFDPSNGDLVGEVATTPAEDIDAIVADAHLAQKKWAKLNVTERVAILNSAYEDLAQQINPLAELLSREMGKDLRRSSGEVTGVAMGSPYTTDGVARAIQPKQIDGGMIEYVPLGVAAVISPWNYPLAMANNLIVPALIAGNSVVFKPSEETPLIAQAFAETLNRHLPSNVLQIVHGGRDLGKAIVEADVNIIAFTGSQAAGKDIMRRSASGLKRLVMELGGNDPMIVLPDADLKRAAQFAVASSFENAGQMCTSTERIYVHESVADRFETIVFDIAQRYQSGPWDQQGVNIGPIINNTQRGKVIDHIDDAISKGARVLLGGGDHPEHYVAPTVLADITPDMRMETEETFGPVVAISRYKDIDTAVDRANDSEFGLGAVVFGNKAAVEIGRRLEAGMIGINGGPGGGGDAPWVGAKQSGIGFHGSDDGHRQFTQVRVIG
ncbi:Succinate-semialdehyde dehydrogenase [NADP(+)] [Pseudovibrio axinellae]|uniref:Succinate-semialdehyde dehydrogenase [NADP(+)] n=1 Tax=Pseudovibrio axinellae TaxID=989403 RepID=A0A165UPC7_9HYPH|nr:aldehyde dehydrogenase family protein [Pseudovibrio axinellae]KZL12650.1 Succinate-semialdehyde dehydrogenase [NADP(+)] [Pseudovibrio axinellae]SEP62953.1 succinate-semialdehyde dehydrogenase / glutarate-semialdehyde dehydrogenase [Pseudovibrio axinellae]